MNPASRMTNIKQGDDIDIPVVIARDPTMNPASRVMHIKSGDDIDIPVAIAKDPTMNPASRMMNINQGNDIDIPVGIATPAIDYVDKQRTTLTKGRSSRLVVPFGSASHALEEHEIRALKAQGYTSGLIEAIGKNSQMFPLRIWVVDNSGSMSVNDGHRIVETASANSVKLVGCSRWTELQETIIYHTQMAGLLQAPTAFRLLNDPGRIAGRQQFSIAERGANLIQEDMEVARQTMRQAKPSGCTPLTEHLREIRENILDLLPQLEQTGQKVAIILATDGLPSDSRGVCTESTRIEFSAALRALEGLPVWIVVRLCTDEDSVVDYYNDLDHQLELSLEVLDDFIGEAKEVYSMNPWLNYCLCLHRMREMGFHHRLLDLLDERQLNLDEVRELLYLLLGASQLDGMPDPQVDFKQFLSHVRTAIRSEKKQWNPISKKMGPWIDMSKLKRTYGEGCCIM